MPNISTILSCLLPLCESQFYPTPKESNTIRSKVPSIIVTQVLPLVYDSLFDKLCIQEKNLIVFSSGCRPGGTFLEPPGLYFNLGFESTGTLIQPFFLKLSESQKPPGLVPVVPPVPPGLLYVE